MKYLLILICTISVCLMLLSGCGSPYNTDAASPSDDTEVQDIFPRIRMISPVYETIDGLDTGNDKDGFLKKMSYFVLDPEKIIDPDVSAAKVFQEFFSGQKPEIDCGDLINFEGRGCNAFYDNMGRITAIRFSSTDKAHAYFELIRQRTKTREIVDGESGSDLWMQYVHQNGNKGYLWTNNKWTFAIESNCQENFDILADAFNFISR